MCAHASSTILGAMLVCCAYSGFSYHPIKWIVGRPEWCRSLTCGIIFDVILGLLSSLVYGFAAYHGTTCVVFLVLIIAAFAESVQVFSYNIFQREMLHSYFRQTGFYKFPDKQDTTTNIVFTTSFHVGLKCYRCMQILIQVWSRAIADFIQIGIIIGIVIGTLGGYVLIKLYAELPFSIYLLFSLMLPTFIILIMVICTLGSIPNENATGFKRYWRWRLSKRVDRMWLQSCPPVGYSFGFVVECRRMTAFTIIDVLVNLIATSALISTR